MGATKGRRRKNPSFLLLPHSVLDHANFYTMSPRAVKLLLAIANQYRGSNNGDLCATYSILKTQGWTSNDQIRKGLNELLERGWIMKTRQGRRPRVASLYAITWQPVDECGGKLETGATKTPPNTWRQEPPQQTLRAFSDHRHAAHTTPPRGPMKAANIFSLNRDTAHSHPK